MGVHSECPYSSLEQKKTLASLRAQVDVVEPNQDFTSELAANIVDPNFSYVVDSPTILPHPLGIKPAGNAYVAAGDLRLAMGSFKILPEDLLVQLLEYLDAEVLRWLGTTCKALYAFTRLEDLWKTLLISSNVKRFKISVMPLGLYFTEETGNDLHSSIQDPDFTERREDHAERIRHRNSISPPAWRGTWRSTYLKIPKPVVTHISCQNIFSDVLYRPHHCAHTSLLPYVRNIPAGNSIARLSDMTSSTFAEEWADRPFILTDPIRHWPLYKTLSIETMVHDWGTTKFRAETVDWPLKSYVDYMNDNQDESPLYLFDRSFVEKMHLKVGENGQYWQPECFGEDLFATLGDQRPDSRWLIVGPQRSGSTFHKDPNATSAWNAVIKGSKYWIMFPSASSDPPPPGVFVSEDQSEVTSPLSIAEWLIGFHAEARKTRGCMEGICSEGEVLHVPSGWWHLVVNLEPSIAVTQNFVPEAHLASVLDFLKTKVDQVSGFRSDVKNPYDLFAQRMKESHPNSLSKALDSLETFSRGKKRKWDDLVGSSSGDHTSTGHTGDLSFGFGFGDEEEIP